MIKLSLSFPIFFFFFNQSVIPENLPENIFSMVIGKRRKVEPEPEPMDISTPNMPKYSSPLLTEVST